MKQTSGEFTLPDEQGDFGDWSQKVLKVFGVQSNQSGLLWF